MKINLKDFRFSIQTKVVHVYIQGVVQLSINYKVEFE